MIVEKQESCEKKWSEVFGEPNVRLPNHMCHGSEPGARLGIRLNLVRQPEVRLSMKHNRCFRTEFLYFGQLEANSEPNGRFEKQVEAFFE